MSISVAIFAIKLGYIVWKRPFIDWMTDIIQAVLALVSMVAINITFFSRNGLLDHIPGMTEYLSMGMMLLFGLVVVGMLAMVAYLVLFKKEAVMGVLGMGGKDGDDALRLEFDMNELWSDDEEYYYEEHDEDALAFRARSFGNSVLPSLFDEPETRTRKKRTIQYNNKDAADAPLDDDAAGEDNPIDDGFIANLLGGRLSIGAVDGSISGDDAAPAAEQPDEADEGGWAEKISGKASELGGKASELGGRASEMFSDAAAGFGLVSPRGSQ
jgi:hypothetical protein